MKKDPTLTEQETSRSATRGRGAPGRPAAGSRSGKRAAERPPTEISTAIEPDAERRPESARWTPESDAPASEKSAAADAPSASLTRLDPNGQVLPWPGKPVAPPDEPAPPLKVPAVNAGLPLRARPAEALRAAREVFTQTSSWVDFYRVVFGNLGVVGKLFPDDARRAKFESSKEFAELLDMLNALRATDLSKIDTHEPQQMITVRLPRSLHERLKKEADRHSNSINGLCISKLLVPIAPRFVPPLPGPRRGRKPGPQGARAAREG